MSIAVKKFLAASLPTLTATKNELVVVSPSPPTLDDLVIEIRKSHADVEASLFASAQRALDAGLQLKSAKSRVRHGDFEDYVAKCGISMRTAQNYMRIAKYETDVRQLFTEKAQGNAYLGIGALLKYVTMLDAKKRHKQKPKKSPPTI